MTGDLRYGPIRLDGKNAQPYTCGDKQKTKTRS